MVGDLRTGLVAIEVKIWPWASHIHLCQIQSVTNVKKVPKHLKNIIFVHFSAQKLKLKFGSLQCWTDCLRAVAWQKSIEKNESGNTLRPMQCHAPTSLGEVLLLPPWAQRGVIFNVHPIHHLLKMKTRKDGAIQKKNSTFFSVQHLLWQCNLSFSFFLGGIFEKINASYQSNGYERR